MPAPTAEVRTKLTCLEIAQRFGVSTARVMRWINSGSLRAIDGNAGRGERRRYLIDVDDLRAFEESRVVVPRETASQQ